MYQLRIALMRPIPSGAVARSMVAARLQSNHIATRLIMARGLATTPEEDGTHQESPSTFKPRLNLRYIRDNIDKVAENARLRKVLDVDLDAYVKAFDQRHTLDTTIKELRSQRNHIAREVTRLVREGNTAATEELSAQGRKIKEEIQQAEDEKLRLEHIVTEIADRIPNDTHPDVPIGPEENARQLRVVGECRVTTDPATPLLDHIALGQHLDLFDLESAASVTGTSFYYLRRAAALLELALIQWSMNRCVARGFTPISTPDIVRMAVANACGFRPRDQEASQTYLVAPNATHRKTHSPSLCLSATAEIPLAGMLAGKAIEKTHRLVAFGRCFRAEAGGRGRENRGLYRVHQFSKVEMFVACGPTESDAMLEEIRDIQESLLSELELTYRVLDMPTEELGASAYRKYDMEAWMPGRNDWGEVSSASNCTDYQARRLDIRWRPDPRQKAVFAHTLNGTACAVPRIILSILETHQTADKRVRIPKALRPWMNGAEYIEPPTL